MKNVLLLLAGLFLGFIADAQARRSLDTGAERTLSVMLSRDSLAVTYLGRPVSILTIAALDSLMKSVPDPAHLHVEFDSYGADPERSRTIGRILEQCACPTRSVNFRQ